MTVEAKGQYIALIILLCIYGWLSLGFPYTVLRSLSSCQGCWERQFADCLRHQGESLEAKRNDYLNNNDDKDIKTRRRPLSKGQTVRYPALPHASTKTESGIYARINNFPVGQEHGASSCITYT